MVNGKDLSAKIVVVPSMRIKKMFKKIHDRYFRWKGLPLALNKGQKIEAVILGVLGIVTCGLAVYFVVLDERVYTLISTSVCALCISEVNRMGANDLAKQLKELKNKEEK
jgi:hypothetical protein